MNIIMKKYIPGLSIAFSLVILISCCVKMLAGDFLDGFALYVIEIAGYLVVAAIVDAIVGMIDIKSYISGFISEAVILYPITLLFAWLGHWFGMRMINLIVFTFFFLVIMILVHVYFFYVTKHEAESINILLEKDEDD